MLNGLVDEFTLTMILRLCLATFLGGIVGMERGSGDRPAGLRTHILVCTGSTLLMIVSVYSLKDTGVNYDGARIAAQVVSGIGFLGAGTILHEGLTVRGLTTAASLWMVAAIGLAVGAGMLLVSCFATVIVLITLVTFHSFEKKYGSVGKIERRYIRVVVKKNVDGVTRVLDYLQNQKVKTRTLSIKDNEVQKTIAVELYLKMSKEDNNMDRILSDIKDLDCVISLENVA